MRIAKHKRFYKMTYNKLYYSIYYNIYIFIGSNKVNIKSKENIFFKDYSPEEEFNRLIKLSYKPVTANNIVKKLVKIGLIKKTNNNMSNNKNLYNAKKEKNDEFYTLYEDVEKELKEYKDQFINKIIYCNCDTEHSNFYKYLSDNFEYYGLKKLIATHYNRDSNSYKMEYDGINYIKTQLIGNGDFRSEECIEILKEADVVITNPPFSLFRVYVAQLMDYNKKFLIIGNMNAITNKKIFNCIKDNKLWVGNNKVKKFIKLDGDIQNFGNILWFTNLINKKRQIDLINDLLIKKYDENDYQKYDNYDAINIDKVKDIPVDYFGYMGVPITYVAKYNPNQFVIIDVINWIKLNDKGLYARIIIKRK